MRLVTSFLAFVAATAVFSTACVAQDPAAAVGGSAVQTWPPKAIRAVDAMFEALPEARWDDSGVLLISRAGGSPVQALDPSTGLEVAWEPQAQLAPDQARAVRAGLFAHRPPVMELPSPDYQEFAGTSGGDVWLRAAGSDEQRRIAAGESVDNGFDIEGAKWSPDGSRLAIKWMDARTVPTIPLIDFGDPQQPVSRIRYSRPGEPVTHAELYIVNRDGSEPIRVDPGEMDAPYLYIIGWNAASDSVFFLRSTRFTDRVELRVADAETGTSRLILDEESDTYIVGLRLLVGYDGQLDDGASPVRLLPDGRFLWISDRDGWTRAYLYGPTGELLRPLSPEGVELGFVAGLDPDGEWLYYTARVDRDRPYDETLFRAPLGGGEEIKLVDGPFFGTIEFDEGRAHFWTVRMGADVPPVLELYASDGTLIRELGSGATAAREAGWRPPEEFVALAADGETELHGLLFTPSDFDPALRYPVIENIYLGPFTSSVPPAPAGRPQALADLGFVVVMVDARNTTGRGREFSHAFHGEHGQHEIADHAGVLRQLGSERPWMDMGRIGVMGFSWGGYSVLRAMLLAPELYSVGVAGAPAVDLEYFRVAIEPYLGCSPDECPETFERGSSTALADRLQGKLFLMHGTDDDDVPFSETIRLITALTDAGKEYDLAVFPGGNHGIGWLTHERYYQERLSAYFLKHLGRPESD